MEVLKREAGLEEIPAGRSRVKFALYVVIELERCTLIKMQTAVFKSSQDFYCYLKVLITLFEVM